MFSEYLDKLRMYGKRHFTFQEIIQDLHVSENAAKAGLFRLKKANKIITPIKGLYVIVPPEHRPYGSIPAEELVPIIMQHLNADYYVGLLSAGLFYGATHQKPARFQVVTNRRIKHPLKFGDVVIELVYKDSLENLPTKDFVVRTGYLKVATPELLTIDLFKYSDRAAGISHIATVLSELTPSIDENKLIELAEHLGEVRQIQRLGFILEKIDVMEDEEKKLKIIDKLLEYMKNANRPFVSLVPYMPRTGCPRHKKWKIVENTDFESDL
ncbi:MAG TPA: type IV toxin-antitoxin system AbiEi family antitoxin [Gammaproteobacteria bacterium]|jgi:predicted transcriptional regulator of viral defense system|nr:type IV toxin-antitoxin system AbiEi family antitoxin [Gammaproteobacteria bacterium]